MHSAWRSAIVFIVFLATAEVPVLAADSACLRNPDAQCVFRLALDEAEKQRRSLFGAGRALKIVALHQAQAGQFGSALATVARMHARDAKRPSTLTAIAVAAASQGDLAQAHDIVRRIEKVHQRQFALRDVAVAQANAGNVASAFETVAAIESKTVQKMALEQVAMAQARAGHPDAARATFEQALDLVEDDIGLGALGERMVEAGEIEWAAKLRPRFQSAREWARLLHDIAHAHARAGRVGEAHAIAAQIDDPEYRAGVTLGIASILARAGRTEEALAIAAQIGRQGGLEERHLAYLAAATVAAGKPSEGLEIARGLTSPDQISRVHSAVGSQQASRGQLQDALDTLEHLVVPLHRATLMSDIALAEARAGDHDAALQRALEIEWADQRVETIAKIALLLFEAHETG